MDKIIANPRFLKKLKAIAKKENRSFQEVQEQAEIYLKELYTERKPFAKLLGYEVMQKIIGRGYEKTIDVNPEEIKKLAKTMRNHPVAFLITHKTYVDPVVLVLALARYGMPWPYMFGGINMSFLGSKQLGKQTGMIFIRRSFKDNEVYKATLRHFIASLLDEGAHFNWAIEGTRSRTGKIVWPKMGILKYIMEGEQESNREVKYVPVSIVYDLIPDVKAITEEGKGLKKKPETLAWFLKYAKKMGEKSGRIAIRFGEPVDAKGQQAAIIPDQEDVNDDGDNFLPRFAFELVHRINQITPVTTVSLVCTALLSNFSLTKKEMEIQVSQLMEFIEKRKQDTLLDRSKPIAKSVQTALNLLLRAGIVQKIQTSLTTQYLISETEYLRANYYSNMAANHFYHRAFIELALIKVVDDEPKKRSLNFWKEIMSLRDLFKFEFFYTNKGQFSDEIEAELELFDPNWLKILKGKKSEILALLSKQNFSVAEAILLTYVEAYKVVLQTLIGWDEKNELSEKTFIEACIFSGKEMHWQGRIRRLDSLSKPFLTNGFRLAKNKKFTPHFPKVEKAKIYACLDKFRDINVSLTALQNLITSKAPVKMLSGFSTLPTIVPGAAITALSNDVMKGEEGPHIAAFFDLDRTLINDFSVKQFMQGRVLSGRMTVREVFGQLTGVFLYASGNKNFASLAASGAQGVKGLDEKIFVELGESVYLRHLAKAIYPEARALVNSHLAKGHTVAIVSAATPYQAKPVARDLEIEHVLCTELEKNNGKFTGKIKEPPCWGEGKAHAARQLAEELNLDLGKSYFYTDSIEDLPLLQIVGHQKAVNPDKKLAQLAFENNWQIYRFAEQPTTTLTNSVRTGLALASFYPSVVKGVLTGAINLSWRKGVNAAIETAGDLGSAMAGLNIIVKGKENLAYRPAVFLFNHQSSSELFILPKVLRGDFKSIAKKELAYHPLGPLFKATGFIFIDRSNKEKAIEALKPAVDALQNGTSVVIAPEGTRSSSKSLGKFKKGAFHLAMQAKVPIVPIVIKNAHDAMPKGSSFVRPTHVEVVVLDPIYVDKWTKKNLEENIAKVRNLYLKELGQI